MSHDAQPPGRPASVTSNWVSVSSALVFVGVVVLAARFERSLQFAVFSSVLALVAFQAAVEIFVRRTYSRKSTGLVVRLEQFRSNLCVRRVLLKLVGLYGTLGVLALIYLFVPEYSSPFYRSFWSILVILAPYLVVLSLIYFLVVDALMVQPEDGYWHAGNLCLLRWKKVDWKSLRGYALGWVIKGFYLPLMTSHLVSSLYSFGTREDMWPMVALVAYVSSLVLCTDLAFVVIGYAFTTRLLDSHIRSVNPFLYGWVACLVLYKPFWPVVRRVYGYNDGSYWNDWFAGTPVLLVIWGTLIILAKLGWGWSNIMFGFRFSNLTHRGIITNGPYRWTKHPSYVSKNISWWLLSVPFLSSSGWVDAVAHCIALLGVNVLYGVRAISEEMHLSEEPTYVAYAEWINEHGVFRWVGRLIPVLRYRPPKSVSRAAPTVRDMPGS
jgi:isoprenylcysteine carboxyl methyltransferase (ICMT) family protein YpbQ